MGNRLGRLGGAPESDFFSRGRSLKTLMLALALLGPFVTVDHAVQDWVQLNTRPALDPAARVLTDVGRPWVVLSLLAGIAVFDRTAGTATAGRALLALVPTNAAVEGLKRLTFRARPDGEHKRSNASFPSSHAANAFTLAAVLAGRWRRLAPAFYAFATGVALSRVVLNRHFLTDIVVGAAIGLAAAWLVDRFLAARATRREELRTG
jgi:membrane-associated phospholipid phosphatase